MVPATNPWPTRPACSHDAGRSRVLEDVDLGVSYELGPFRLDPEAGMLTHAGKPVGLGVRGVAVLSALVGSANRVVTKDKIMRAAWPGLVVEESNLSVQITAVRRALAQTPGGERWVETLARRGYRFVGPVAVVSETSSHAAEGRARSNLPQPPTAFVGRERELVEIKRLLPKARLLTVVGIGGIGKTRLALQVAAELMGAYRDGVRFVDLAPLADAALVPSAAAEALGVREVAGTPLHETLCAALMGRELLLLLDNCEHLLESSAKLADALLRGAAGLSIIATSREPLRLVDEQSFPLQPLSLPKPGAPSDIARSDAVQLFVDRVQRQLPGFELTPDRALAVAEVCIHLDGIPLALELAAARARSLSVEQINARLGDRFKLLTGGSRVALPRQQTLRATFDWSYDLLDDAERALLRWLSIFPGSFDVEAAAAVASDGSIDDSATIDLLSQLVSRSLVVADTSAPMTRYRLLETTRAYAMEKLVETGGLDAARRRHAEHFRDLFARAPDDWLRIPDEHWQAIYMPELDNVRVALDWALAPGGDANIGIGLSAGAAALWTEAGLRTEGPQRIDAALAAIGPRERPLDQARLWFWLAVHRSRLTEELDGYEHALDNYRRAGNASELGLALVRVGGVMTFLGRTDAAAAFLAEAGPLLERAGPPKALAEYLLNRGSWKWFTHDLAGARADLETSATLCEQSETSRVGLNVVANLAEIAWLAGDLDAALSRYREAVALARQKLPARKSMLAMFLTNVAGIHVERGELDDALVAACEGLPMRQELGSAAWALDFLGLRLALIGKWADAARVAGHADDRLEIRQAAKRQPNEARARERLQAILHKKLARDDLEHLLGEGATMTEDQICRIALDR